MAKDFEGADYGGGMGFVGKVVILIVIVLAVISGVFIYTNCRVNVPNGYLLPVTKLYGKSLSNEMVLAPSGEFQGPQIGPLKEGRHWLNPMKYTWDEPIPALDIPQGKVEVLIRKFGKPIDPEQVVAMNSEEKGIIYDVMKPGRVYGSPWEFDHETHDMVNIPPGFRGIVNQLVGKRPENPNVFVVRKGERGTQPFLLPEGTYPEYSNPYVYRVIPMDIRSQKFDLGGGGENIVTFPSQDGFDIIVEGTIEWSPIIDDEMLPRLFVTYVDEEDMKASGGINNIQNTLILPYARSFFRITGGEHKAVDYITGNTRIMVQSEVEKKLVEVCAKEGVQIKSFVIRSTEPPQKIRKQYERREMANRQIDQYRKEIETEVGLPVDEQGKPLADNAPGVLDVQGNVLRKGGRVSREIEVRRKDRETQLGDVRQQIAVVFRESEEYARVQVTMAQKDLAVALINLEAAQDNAAGIVAKGSAEAAVTVMKNQAAADGIKAKVAAFKTGDKYAEYQIIQKIAPAVKRILSNTDSGISSWFTKFAVPVDEAAPAQK